MAFLTDLMIYSYSLLGQNPRIYYGIMKAYPKFNERMVKKNTDIVIEGYPRCANTFAVRAFRLSQEKNYQIAHHAHVPAQIIKACEWGIPTLLLIRNPQDSVLSLKTMRPKLSVKVALKRYISFYEKTYYFRLSVVIGHFEDVTSNFGQVIQIINEKYNTDFTLFEHTKQNVDRIFSKMDNDFLISKGKGTLTENQLTRPSEKKEAIKMKFNDQLKIKANKKLLEKAETIYFKY
ncbi:MAG: hypothetical protein ACFFB5_00640 [Promethearchaeota archaeon]